MLRVFIGYDKNEPVTYHVLCHSIIRHASRPVSITAINKDNIPEFTRAIEDGSTEFSFSRFLTPYLSGYTGYSIFMDSDMLLLDDIYKVLDYISLRNDVSVVKHDYKPKEGVKFLGNKQYAYPRKNWSSFMVFNNCTDSCKDLTVKVVNEQSGAYLHRFQWANEDRIGELPKEWNHLVGEYEENSNAIVAHFTLGAPCFDGYESQEYAKEWFEEKELMEYSA